MNALPRIGVLVAAVTLAPALLCPLGASPAQTPTTEQTFVEIQTRGPVHEAFAQPGDVAYQPSPTVPKGPPDPIPEEPPDVRPEGDSVVWIGGYWAWDADLNEFIWVSGTYRDAPAGRVYVAGYWEQTPDGWRWVHGFWAPAEQPELPYVPPPPTSVEVGPSVPPPGDNYIYTPGCWIYREARYVWRPGHYIPCRPDFVWVPPCYLWTPGGCVFVSGYWDRPLERRGLLFASVAFRQPLWRDPSWAWRPHYAVGFRPLLDSLFVDARFGHYRYGDYYGKTYLDRGIQPWHAYGPKRYDPLYTHYRWENRNNPGWQTNLVKVYDDRLAGKAARPPQSFKQQSVVVNQTNNANLKVVQPVGVLADSGVKLTKVPAAQIAQQKVAVKQLHEASQLRLKTETAIAKQPQSVKTGTPQTLKVAQLPQAGAVIKSGQEMKVTGPKMDHKPPTDIKPAIINKTPKVDLKPPTDVKPTIINKTPKVDIKPPTDIKPAIVNKAPHVDSKPAIINKAPHVDSKPAKVDIKQPLPPVKEHKQEFKPVQTPAKSVQAAPKKVTFDAKPAAVVKTPTPQAKAVHAAPAVKTATPQPRVTSTPATRQVHAGPPPRSQPAAHDNGSKNKKKGG